MHKTTWLEKAAAKNDNITGNLQKVADMLNKTQKTKILKDSELKHFFEFYGVPIEIASTTEA